MDAIVDRYWGEMSCKTLRKHYGFKCPKRCPAITKWFPSKCPLAACETLRMVGEILIEWDEERKEKANATE